MSDLGELTGDQIERALRWALIDQGSAALSRADGVLRLRADLAVRMARRLADSGNVDLTALQGLR